MRGTLTIRNLRVVALMPPDHPEPESFRARLEDTVRASLGPALAETVGDWAGEGILRIHRLEVDLTTSATLQPNGVTIRLAEAIAEGLVRARANGERTFTYVGRSHYLAAFLQELAAGRAWQRWWFRSFDGLKVLPLSAAIRTAVLADPETGLSALLSLPRAALATVLAKLSDHDGARVLDSFAALGDSGASQERVGAALLAARRESTEVRMVPPTAAALTLYIDALRPGGECRGPRLAELATALVVLDRLLVGRKPAATIELARILASDLHAGLPATDAALLAPLVSLPADLRQALIRTATRHRGGAAARDAAPRRYTSFGGLFLVLPSLDLESIEEAIKEIVDTETKEEDLLAARLVGLLTLAACAGRQRATHVVADPIWRELFGLPPADDESEIKAMLAALPEGIWSSLEAIAEAVAARADARFLLLARSLAPSGAAARTIAGLARATLTRFARRLPGFASSSAPFLWCNLLDVAAAVDSVGAGLSVLLDRCPLDVLLSINGIADSDITGPGGTAVRLRRRPL